MNLPFITVILFLLIAPTTWSQTIVIVGDMPYSDTEKQMLQGPNGSLYQLINKTQPSAVLHLGDLKSGSTSCTNTLLNEHKALLAQLYPTKIIYTPGDNEWTDCDRKSLTPNFDELERLDYLITLMYQTPPLLESGLANIEAQQHKIENKLWVNDRLAIATIHLVGTSNGRTAIKKSNTKQAIAQANLRDEMNFSWLKKIEGKAQSFDALIIAFHADIYNNSQIETGPCNDEALTKCDAYPSYRQLFKDLAKRLNKPILITHGDTGEFCFEQRGDNLWHLNAAGDYAHSDAATVTFDKNAKQTPFIVKGMINPEFPQQGCAN